ncbi:hypothetical protein ACHAPX_004618 [Trichoderma viride]|jgi:hypothetical protein
MREPTDAWVQSQFMRPTRFEGLAETINLKKTLNYESMLQQFGRMNNIGAVFAHEAATEEASDVINAGLRFIDNGFSLEIGGAGIISDGFSFEIKGSRTTRQTAATAETTRRRAARDANTIGVPSQSGIHVYKKIGTVKMQSWFDGEDCHVTAPDAGFVCGNMRRAGYRS